MNTQQIHTILTDVILDPDGIRSRRVNVADLVSLARSVDLNGAFPARAGPEGDAPSDILKLVTHKLRDKRATPRKISRLAWRKLCEPAWQSGWGDVSPTRYPT